MFEHSVRVPRLYKIAAHIAQKVKEDGASLKQLVYEKVHPNKKAIYSLVINTLQHDENLNSIIRHTQILTKETRLDPWLTRVLISELLWGKKKLPGESKPVQTILSYQDQFSGYDIVEKTTKPKTKKVIKPKYVRINTLKLEVPHAVDFFRNDGWSLVRCGDGSDYAAFLATSASLSEDQFMVDILVKELLLFPPGAQFYDHKLYKNGSIVLQDKASCLAPFLLNPPDGSTVLDMCAAPGMKCTQLAAMVPSGQVYAVERDKRRFDTLEKLLDTAGADNVKAINLDVMTLTDTDLPDVEYILVDPSCSGSGMLDRIEFEDPTAHCNESRLEKLAGFQITILRHALNNFKSAKRVIYSTCSTYPQENENVVQLAITTTPDFKLVPLNEQLKDKWYNFGAKKFGKIGESCLYAKPERDRTNGFFIALFERLKEGETNEFFIKRVQRSSECESVEDKMENNTKKKKKNKNNANVLQNKNDEIEDDGQEITVTNKKKKKKKHSKKTDNEEQKNLEDNESAFEQTSKDAQKHNREHEMDKSNGNSEEKLKKKKKRKHSNKKGTSNQTDEASENVEINETDEIPDNGQNTDVVEHKIKKKKRRMTEKNEINEEFNNEENSKSKKKKRNVDNTDENCKNKDVNTDETVKKRKKKTKTVDITTEDGGQNDSNGRIEENSSQTSDAKVKNETKKKKKHKYIDEENFQNDGLHDSNVLDVKAKKKRKTLQ